MRKFLILLGVVGLSMFGVGCESEPDTPSEKLQDIGDEMGDAMEDVGDEIGDAAEDVGDAIEDAVDE